MIWFGFSGVLACSSIVNGGMALVCDDNDRCIPAFVALASAGGALCCAAAGLVSL